MPIGAYWCSSMIIYSDWFQLMLMVINSDWYDCCWLMLIATHRSWLMLVDVDLCFLCWLMPIWWHGNSCQKFPKKAKNYKVAECKSIIAKSWQKLTKVAKSCHKLPKVPKGNGKLPKFAKCCQNIANISKQLQLNA